MDKIILSDNLIGSKCSIPSCNNYELFNLMERMELTYHDTFFDVNMLVELYRDDEGYIRCHITMPDDYTTNRYISFKEIFDKLQERYVIDEYYFSGYAGDVCIGWFKNVQCSKLDLTHLDCTNTRGFDGMFTDANIDVIKLPDSICRFDVSCTYMFRGCITGDLNINIFNNKDIYVKVEGMFSECRIRNLNITRMHLENFNKKDKIFMKSKIFQLTAKDREFNYLLDGTSCNMFRDAEIEKLISFDNGMINANQILQLAEGDVKYISYIGGTSEAIEEAIEIYCNNLMKIDSVKFESQTAIDRTNKEEFEFEVYKCEFLPILHDPYKIQNPYIIKYKGRDLEDAYGRIAMFILSIDKNTVNIHIPNFYQRCGSADTIDFMDIISKVFSNREILRRSFNLSVYGVLPIDTTNIFDLKGFNFVNTLDLSNASPFSNIKLQTTFSNMQVGTVIINKKYAKQFKNPDTYYKCEIGKFIELEDAEVQTGIKRKSSLLDKMASIAEDNL